MRKYLIGFACFLMVSCGETRVETVTLVPEVPEDLRTPCVVVEREIVGLKDVGLVLADHVGALDCANGKIVATDEILDAAEAEAEKVRPNL